MDELRQYLELSFKSDANRIIISHPAAKSEVIKKITIERKGKVYQISKYSDKQVFHENISMNLLVDRCYKLICSHYRQVNIISLKEEHIILISKKGSCNYKVKKLATDTIKAYSISTNQNRKKNYILKDGMNIEPLVDMGVFSSDGRVINSMYDKYKQINRFVEIINDEIQDFKGKEINVIDFGCGKSYLTFVVYYYLTVIRKLKANVIGLDLKKDVIDKCNIAAKKYGYSGLIFTLGDINGFKAPFSVDMVITLHACDTATDYALYNAVKWNAKMIFSVPCCQHELNKQISPHTLSLISQYGIIKERFSALATDAIRGNILEYCGYKTQLLEFINFDHTPKNILIRAIRRQNTPKKYREQRLNEVETMMREFDFVPTIYKLLVEDKTEKNDD